MLNTTVGDASFHVHLRLWSKSDRGVWYMARMYSPTSSHQYSLEKTMLAMSGVENLLIPRWAMGFSYLFSQGLTWGDIISDKLSRRLCTCF